MKMQRALSKRGEKRGAKYVSMAVVVCFLGVVLLHSYRGSVGKRQRMPEDVVLKMFDAMERGDMAAYLSLLAEDARARAELMLSEAGEREFKRQLKSMHEGIKGIAVSKLEQLSDDEVVLKVELVFESKNEVQQVRLKRIKGEWKVVEVMQSKHLTPPIPYGTPVDRL